MQNMEKLKKEIEFVVDVYTSLGDFAKAENILTKDLIKNNSKIVFYIIF